MLIPQAREVLLSDLVDLYDWPHTTWVRACMVRSLDGGVAGPDGLSASISSPTDRAVLSAIRALADAYLVGAGTVRAEQYSAVRARPEMAQRRVADGQDPVPRLAVVSRSCRLDWDGAAFLASQRPPIVLTTGSASPADRAAASAAGCEVVMVGHGDVDPAAALAELRDRGLSRVVAEGGPALLAQLVRARLVDEVDLTVSPTTVAAPHPEQTGPAVLTRMRLQQVLADDGFLFTRHLRAEPT